MALSAAIILAAGEGTRMRSSKPKVLHTLAGKTFLNRVMNSVSALNPDTLAVVVHYQAERVAAAARSYDERVTIVNQDDIPGTGRAVQCAMAQLQENGALDGVVLIAASDMPLPKAKPEGNTHTTSVSPGSRPPAHVGLNSVRPQALRFPPTTCALRWPTPLPPCLPKKPCEAVNSMIPAH